MNDPDTDGKAVGRRAFLKGAAVAGATLVASRFMGTADASGRPVLELVNVPDNGNFPGIPGRNKSEQVMNYALTLEILEADLYRQALNVASGKPLDTPLSGDTSVYTLAIDPGGLFDMKAQEGFGYLRDFAGVEAAHRDFLHAAILSEGATPVQPNAGGYHADFGSDLQSILALIRDVEETGVRAYLGAAQFITSTTQIQTAATIYSTEARHSAALNYVLGLPAGPSRRRLDSQAIIPEHGDNNFEHFQTPEQIMRKVRPFFA